MISEVMIEPLLNEINEQEEIQSAILRSFEDK